MCLFARLSGHVELLGSVGKKDKKGSEIYRGRDESENERKCEKTREEGVGRERESKREQWYWFSTKMDKETRQKSWRSELVLYSFL